MNTVHYKDPEDGQMQIERHKTVENEEREPNANFRWNEAKMDSKLDTLQDEFLDMMTEFESI